MKILVSGAGGQLGRDIVRELSSDQQVLGLDRKQWDVTQPAQTRLWVEQERPDVIIHCAAETQVDECEGNPLHAYLTNTAATKVLASLCRKRDIRLIYISTDYVFDGTQKNGYVESDPVRPINIYGKTKWLGEQWVARLCPQHIIVRTAWVFGIGGNHFPGAILRQAREGKPLRVVNDQVGSPTYTRHLAAQIRTLLDTNASGIFHTAGSGSCSWYELAEAVLHEAGFRPPVIPISSQELKRAAPRPACSILRSERGISLPHWREGVASYMRERGRRGD